MRKVAGEFWAVLHGLTSGHAGRQQGTHVLPHKRHGRRRASGHAGCKQTQDAYYRHMRTCSRKICQHAAWCGGATDTPAGRGPTICQHEESSFANRHQPSKLKPTTSTTPPGNGLVALLQQNSPV